MHGHDCWSLSVLDGGRTEIVNTRRTVRVVIDLDEFDMHIEASGEALPSDLAYVLADLERAGLTLIDEDECPPLALDDGGTRIYLRPTEAWDDMNAKTLLEVG